MNISAATAIYQAMGQKDVSTQRVACIAEGESLCRYITTWGEGQPGVEKRR